MHWIILTGLLLAADLCASVVLATDARARPRDQGAQARSEGAIGAPRDASRPGSRHRGEPHARNRARASAGGPGTGPLSGLASIYGGSGSKYGGRRTASGERGNSGALTAAHRTLPFGTMVQVTNRRNGRSVVVRINDRGPFIRGRVIDVTPAAARALGFSGLTGVSLAVVGRK